MTNELHQLSTLFRKYQEQSLTAAEREELDAWVAASDHNRAVWERMNDVSSATAEIAMFYSYDVDRIREEIGRSIPQMQVQKGIPAFPVFRGGHFLRMAWFRYAAILLLMAVAAAFLYQTYNGAQQEITQKRPATDTGPDIQPGGDKAILTLADGSTITLDTASIGSLAQQGNTKILKLDAGSLAYQSGTMGGEVVYNTISTPNGGQYQIALPDGSKVWLNAASSIRFPTVFTGQREVRITGEVYFEVAANGTSPFLVQTVGTTIQVLGTSFNVNSYTNEGEEKTTLLEGSIKIIPEGELNKSVLIRPGQQTIHNLTASGLHALQVINNIDVDQVIAWKNGMLSLQNASFATVARQLERWYDIEIRYEGAVPKVRFKGGIDRALPLSGVLRFLSNSGIRTRLEGKTLTIIK